MWRMQDGDRVLTDAEWALFATGLDLLRDSIEADIGAGTDDVDTGIPVFDRLTPEQKQALLADNAHVRRCASWASPEEVPPEHRDPQDFERLAVIEPAGHGPAGDGDPDQLAVLGSAEGELAADRGQVVPVVLGDKLVGFSKVKWDCIGSA